MKPIFYNSDNKTPLTPEQQENVIKVVIIAKKLMIYMSSYVFSQKLKYDDKTLNKNTKSFLNQISNQFKEANSTRILKGDKYTLESNIDDNRLCIRRKLENTILIESEMKTHKVKLVNNLTEHDAKLWEQVGQILQVDYRDSVKGSNPS